MAWNEIKDFEMDIEEHSGKKYLRILIPMEDPPQPSKTSGKNMLVASTHGVYNTKLDLFKVNRTLRCCINVFYPILNNKKCNTKSGSYKQRRKKKTKSKDK